MSFSIARLHDCGFSSFKTGIHGEDYRFCFLESVEKFEKRRANFLHFLVPLRVSPLLRCRYRREKGEIFLLQLDCPLSFEMYINLGAVSFHSPIAEGSSTKD